MPGARGYRDLTATVAATEEDRNSGFNSPAGYFDDDTATVMAENFSPAMLAGKGLRDVCYSLAARVMWIPRTLDESCEPARTALLVYDMQVGITRKIKGTDALRRIRFIGEAIVTDVATFSGRLDATRMRSSS